MDDAVLKKLIENTATETRRHFDIVAEELRRELQAVAEGVAMNGEKLDRLESRIEQIASDLDVRVMRLEAASSQ